MVLLKLLKSSVDLVKKASLNTEIITIIYADI